MLRRSLVILIELVGFLVFVCAIALGGLSYYIDTEQFRSEFCELATESIGRPVQLNGELNIQVWPNLSLEVIDLSIDDINEHEPMARFDVLRVSVALMPLLTKDITVQSILVEGLNLNLLLDNAGQLNWQPVLENLRKTAELTEQGVESDTAFSLRLNTLEVEDADILFVNRRSGQTLSLEGINLRTGNIQAGEPVSFSTNSKLILNQDKLLIDLIGKGVLELDETGENILLRNTEVSATIDGPFIPKGEKPAELIARVQVDVPNHRVTCEKMHLRYLDIIGEGSALSEDWDSGLNIKGHLALRPFSPAKVVSKYLPVERVNAVDGLKQASASTDFSITKDGVTLSNLAASLDDLKVSGTLGVKDYTDPQLDFALKGGMVDLDRYLPLFRTGTPFIWSDFALSFFASLRGHGKADVSGFKVLDEVLNDLHAEATATGKGINIIANANWASEGPIHGEGMFAFARNSTNGNLTMGIQCDIKAQSSDEGFRFLDVPPMDVRGRGDLNVRLSTAPMDCPENESSLSFFEHTSLDMSLALETGELLYVEEKKSIFKKDFSKFLAKVKVAPARLVQDEMYSFNVDCDVRSLGGQEIRTIALTTQGSVVVDADSWNISSNGLKTKMAAGGTLFTDQSNRLNSQADVSFDVSKKVLALDKVNLRLLEALLTGQIAFTGLGERFSSSGNFEINGANVRRIIFLLTRVGIKTRDREALKGVSLKSRFTMDDKGFKLEDLRGEVDGTIVTGTIEGSPWNRPLLKFALTAGSFDLDRYLPPSTGPSVEEMRKGYEYHPDPVYMPVEFLRALRLDGTVFFQSFKLARIRPIDLKCSIAADSGVIKIDSLQGWLHDGTFEGHLHGNVTESSMATSLKLQTKGMNAGSFMTELAGKDYVRGKTDINIELRTTGITDVGILSNLKGMARIAIDDGSFKFTGYDARPEQFDPHGKKTNKEDDPRKRRTLFKSSLAVFNVDKGIFTIKQYQLDSPLLKSHGTGYFNVAAGTIDMTFRNDFVAVPSVPIHVVGRLADPKVEIPKAQIVNDTVWNILSIPAKSFNFVRDLF